MNISYNEESKLKIVNAQLKEDVQLFDKEQELNKKHNKNLEALNEIVKRQKPIFCKLGIGFDIREISKYPQAK